MGISCDPGRAHGGVPNPAVKQALLAENPLFNCGHALVFSYQTCSINGAFETAGTMKLYRINKVTKPGGLVLKKKNVLATSNKEAMQIAADSPDCPVCEILKDGHQVGSIV